MQVQLNSSPSFSWFLPTELRGGDRMDIDSAPPAPAPSHCSWAPQHGLPRPLPLHEVARHAGYFSSLPGALLAAGSPSDAVMGASAVLSQLPWRADVRLVRAQAAASAGLFEYALGDVDKLLVQCGPDAALTQLRELLLGHIQARQAVYAAAP